MLYTGLADGRIVGFKGGELWEVTRTGELHPDCGMLRSKTKVKCKIGVQDAEEFKETKIRKHLSGFYFYR